MSTIQDPEVFIYLSMCVWVCVDWYKVTGRERERDAYWIRDKEWHGDREKLSWEKERETEIEQQRERERGCREKSNKTEKYRKVLFPSLISDSVAAVWSCPGCWSTNNCYTTCWDLLPWHILESCPTPAGQRSFQPSFLTLLWETWPFWIYIQKHVSKDRLVRAEVV